MKSPQLGLHDRAEGDVVGPQDQPRAPRSGSCSPSTEAQRSTWRAPAGGRRSRPRDRLQRVGQRAPAAVPPARVPQQLLQEERVAGRARDDRADVVGRTGAATLGARARRPALTASRPGGRAAIVSDGRGAAGWSAGWSRPGRPSGRRSRPRGATAGRRDRGRETRPAGRSTRRPPSGRPRPRATSGPVMHRARRRTTASAWRSGGSGARSSSTSGVDGTSMWATSAISGSHRDEARARSRPRRSSELAAIAAGSPRATPSKPRARRPAGPVGEGRAVGLAPHGASDREPSARWSREHLGHEPATCPRPSRRRRRPRRRDRAPRASSVAPQHSSSARGRRRAARPSSDGAPGGRSRHRPRTRAGARPCPSP